MDRKRELISILISCFLFIFVSIFSFMEDSYAADSFSVVIKSPLNMATVSGKIAIEVEVVKDGDVLIEKVALLINGVLFTEFRQPPYRISWDAGPEFRDWSITAVAYSKDGRTASQSIRTRKLKIDQHEYVNLVNVYASVKDKNNDFVENLKREDFVILEDKVPQEIERFSVEWKPLFAAIVLDSSLTMKGDKLQTAKESAIAFTEALGKDDKLAIISFNDAIKVLEGFTTDFSRIKEAIMEVEASGGTALYDAIYRASDMMKNIDARKVIVLLSDGRDESTSGLTPGSLHTFEESIDKALRNEVIVFSIGVGKNLDREMDFYNRKNLKEILDQLASDTGGIFYSAERIGQVKKAYSMIAEELKHQYSMAFPPGTAVRDGSWRTIQVKTKYPDYRVIARKGYFAPKE